MDVITNPFWDVSKGDRRDQRTSHQPSPMHMRVVFPMKYLTFTSIPSVVFELDLRAQGHIGIRFFSYSWCYNALFRGAVVQNCGAL